MVCGAVKYKPEEAKESKRKKEKEREKEEKKEKEEKEKEWDKRGESLRARLRTQKRGAWGG